MTNQTSSSEPGYRGSLAAREDRLARPWILTVLAIFVLVLVLSIAGIPSRLIPDPTPVPLPSPPPSSSAEASPSASESPSASPSESASVSASEPASESASPSASGTSSP